MKPNLAVVKLPAIDIDPPCPLSPPKLTIQPQHSVSIPPRRIYHPAVINACYSIIGKHPSQMTAAEDEEFQLYMQFKLSRGQNVEDDVVFLPIGGIRTCLHCENLT